jgi:hypothetical protein
VPKPPGKTRDRLGAHQEMHLADGEIVEVEAQVGRDIGVGRLFMRQHDVQPDRDAARLGGAAVAGLHHAGAAAGDDDMLAAAGRHAAQRHQAREFRAWS